MGNCPEIPDSSVSPAAALTDRGKQATTLASGLSKHSGKRTGRGWKHPVLAGIQGVRGLQLQLHAPSCSVPRRSLTVSTETAALQMGGLYRDGSVLMIRVT